MWDDRKRKKDSRIMKILIVDLLFVIGLCAGAVLHRTVHIQTIEAEGLYDGNDKVIILTNSTLKDLIFNQEYASYVEFYNAYCGHCKRFAPSWKALADDISGWQGVAMVMAIDCSSDKNNDICREFEIMFYPAIRYFSPYAQLDTNNFGLNVDGQEITDLREKYIEFLRNETHVPEHWPKLSAFKGKQLKELFDNVPDHVDYIFLIYNSNESSVGNEVALDLHLIKEIVIRQIETADVGLAYGLSITRNLAVINRNLEIVKLPIHTYSRTVVATAIKEFLSHRGIFMPVVTNVGYNPNGISGISDNIRNQKVIEYVKLMNGAIYQADLEQAIRYTLFHEIPTFSEISGERLVALQRYINVIQRLVKLNLLTYYVKY